MRRQYTAELIPIIVYKGDVIIGNGWFLIREDGRQSVPVLYDNENNLIPDGPYSVVPLTSNSLLVIVPENNQ